MSIRFVASTVLTAKDATKGAFAAMARNAKNAEMAVRRLKVAGRELKDMGKDFSGFVSAPVAALGANALSMATNFEGAMNTVQSKLLITQGEMVALRNQAKDLGASTAFSATQAGDAMGYLAQAGLNANQILTATPVTLNLASAAGLELANAADIATNVMGAFQLQMDAGGKNITRVADVLALASAKSNTSVQELAEGMKTAAPIAKGFGMNVEQTSAMLGMLANMGIKAGEGGTVFKNMMANLAAPAGSAIKALDKLGIKQSMLFDKMKDGSLAFKGVSNMLGVLEKTGAGATDMLAIFGREAGPGMISIMKSAEGIKDLEKALQTSGAASNMAKIKMQGLPGVMAALKSSWEAANIAMVESGGFGAIIDGLKAATSAMQSFAKSNPELLAKIVKIGTIAAIIGPALLVVGGALASVGVIAKTAAAAMFLFTPAALPIVAAASAIGGAAYLIYKNWDQLSVFFKGFGMGLQASFRDIKAAIQPALDAFGSVYHWITDLVMPVDKLSSGVAGLASEGYRYGAMMKWIIAPLGAFAAAVVAMKSFSMIAGGISLVAGAIKAVGAVMLANPIGLAVAAIAGAVYLIYKNWDGISAWFSEKWETVKTAFSSFTGWLGNAFLNYTPAGLIYKHWDGIGAWFSQKLESVKSAFSSFTGWLGNVFLNYTPAGLIYKHWDGIGAWFSALWNNIKTIVGDSITELIQLMSNFSPSEILKKSFDDALNYMKTLPAEFMKMGSNIIAGIKTGISGAASDASDAIGGVADDIKSGFKNLLNINSPSRVFAEYGANITQGLAVGINRDGSAVKAMTQSAAQLEKAAKVKLPAIMQAVGVDNQGQPAAPAMPDLKQVISYAAGTLPAAPNLPAANQAINYTAGALPSLPSLPSLKQFIDVIAGDLPTISGLSNLQQMISPVLGEAQAVQTLGSPDTRMDGSITADINLKVESDGNGVRVSNVGTETSSRGSLIRNVGISMERLAY